MKLSAKRARIAQAFQRTPNKRKQAIRAAAIGAVMMSPQLAFAGDGTELLCFIAQYFKTIAGTAALVVIGMWTLEHFFGVAKLHDVVIKVGIGAAFIISAAVLVAKSGLSSGCVW
jgi:hypothetical protein